MRYMGSKRRIAKEILPIILKDRKLGQCYVEPFVGGCNTFAEVPEPKIGADSHQYLIALLQAAAKGWLPPKTVTKEEYNLVMSDKDKDPTLTGYCGFALTFGNKWSGGYVSYESEDRWGHKHKDETGYLNAVKTYPKIKNCTFVHSDYLDLKVPLKSIIYCDPPYESTTKYAGKNFNSAIFWGWCENKVKEGHKVFVSEYSAPEGWVPVWEKSHTTKLNGNNNKKAIEKLFVHESQVGDV